MTEPKRTLHDMEMEVKLDQIKDMEKELAKLEQGHSLFTLSNFRAKGLPILAGLIDDNFNPAAWVDYVGHHHVGLKVANDSLTEVIYIIPPLLGQLVSMLNNDPDEPSLNEESQRMSYIRDINPQGASAQLFNNAMDGLDKAHPTAEEDMRTAAGSCYAVLNKIFADHKLPTIPVPEELAQYVTSKNKAKVAATVETSYDLDDGEDF